MPAGSSLAVATKHERWQWGELNFSPSLSSLRKPRGSIRDCVNERIRLPQPADEQNYQQKRNAIPARR